MTLKLSESKFPIKCYTTKELRVMYDVPKNTFCEWLMPIRKELKIGKRRVFTIKEVEFIFNRLGVPGKYLME
jgi:hypothetical protein